MKKILNLLVLSIVYTTIGTAQISTQSDLYKTLKAQDSLMFLVGFNNCDIAQIEKIMLEDVEFYHDKGGITKTKSAFSKEFKANLCSNGVNSTQRILEDNSLEVFPLYNGSELYGALQMGVHGFGNTTARFTHLWLIENEEWKLSRILSYDHQQKQVELDNDIKFITLTQEQLVLYKGDYQFSPEFVLSIVAEGDKLYGDAQGQKVEIKPYGNHRFLDSNETMKLNFKIDKGGEVIGLTILGPNRTMEAKKINKN